MSELKSHQEIIDSIKKLVIEIDHERDESQISNQPSPLNVATIHLAAAASALMYIDGKLSASKFIDLLELAHVADLAAIELFLNDAAQAEEQD
ncbi:hypothetical protein [Sutterella wadsworthensis]|uniref:hypothetical protein n=1 Tax=Sutterella wadsworthensis TaxID=40545 RepID=UPI003AEFE320